MIYRHFDVRIKTTWHELHFGLFIEFSFLAVWQNVHTSNVIMFFFFVHYDLEAVGQRYPFTLNLSPK